MTKINTPATTSTPNRIGRLPLTRASVPPPSAPADTLGAVVRFLVLYDEPADAAEFDRHDRQVHVPLAKPLAGLRRYTVSRSGTRA
jgi:hypothetical protein